VKAKIEVMPQQPGGVPRTMASTVKARILLGYMSKITVDEGIKKLWRGTIKLMEELSLTNNVTGAELITNAGPRTK